MLEMCANNMDELVTTDIYVVYSISFQTFFCTGI